MMKNCNKIRTVLLCFMLIALLCFGLTACTDPTDYTVTANYNSEQGNVKISPDAENGTYREGTQLTVTVTPNEGFAVDTFAISTDEFAFLNAENEYTFTVSGNTSITVTFKEAGEEQVEYLLTVPASVENGKIQVSPKWNAYGKYAENTELTVTLVPEEGYSVESFTVGGEDKMDELDNNVYKFNITADTEINATFKSNLIAVESVTLDQSTLELEVGGREEAAVATLVATVLPEDATDKNVTWESDHPEIATVEDGIVTALAEGEAIITAKVGDASATCTVTVSQHTHSFGEWKDEEPATCVAEGKLAHKECTLCGKFFDNEDKEIEDVTIPVDEDAHNLVDMVGDEGHWQECGNEGCDYKSSVTSHKYDGALVNKGEDGHANKCSIGECTYESAVTAHSAKAGSQYQANEDNTKHFKLCECGAHVDEEEHFATSWEHDDGDMSTGEHYKICEECGLKFAEASHVSSEKPVNGQNGHHFSCTVCTYVGEDEEHVNADGKWTNDANAGGAHQHYYYCSLCDAKVSENGRIVFEHDDPDGEYEHCDKCDYRIFLGTHKLEYVKDSDTTHYADCTNPRCVYKSESVACKDSGQVVWTTDVENPENGHTGLCVCGNTFALEAHDTDGENGACSKCGYAGEHECVDEAENGYYDGICDLCGKNYNNTWTFSNGTITKYNGSYSKVKIPEKIDGIAVTTLMGGSNQGLRGNTTITDIIVPASITSLATNAFNGCSNLVSAVILANITELPQQCFHNCKQLASLVLSASITSINKRAFGLNASGSSTVLKTIYYLGTQEAWDAMKEACTDDPAKTTLSNVDNVYIFSAQSESGKWHWKDSAENMIPELWN